MEHLKKDVKSKGYVITYIVLLAFLTFSFGFNMALFNTLGQSVVDYYQELSQEDLNWVQ